MAKSPHTTPEPEWRNTVRDLCRRWRYMEAKLTADCIVTEEDNLDKLTSTVEDELKAIEEQILAADPAGAGDAAEILRVVLDLLGEDSTVGHRDTALLRHALKALARAKGRWPSEIDAEAPEPQPAKPSPKAEPSIRELCHQWDITRAKLDLDILEATGDIDDLVDAAHERYHGIALAILTTEPDDISDDDIVAMLRLARKVIGNDEYRDEQEQWAQQMLGLIDTTLCRRTVAALLKQRAG